MKNNDYFSFFRKNLQKFFKNPNFMTFCDDVINGDVINGDVI